MNRPWKHRVRPPVPDQSQHVEQKLQMLGEQLNQMSQRGPTSRRGIVFQTISDIFLLASGAIGVTLGTIHLWKAVHRKDHAHQPDHSPDPAAGGSSDQPPRRHVAAIAGYDRDDHHRGRG